MKDAKLNRRAMLAIAVVCLTRAADATDIIATSPTSGKVPLGLFTRHR